MIHLNYAIFLHKQEEGQAAVKQLSLFKKKLEASNVAVDAEVSFILQVILH